MTPGSQNHSLQPDPPKMTDLRCRPHRSHQDAPCPKQSRTFRQLQAREVPRGRRTTLLLRGKKAGMSKGMKLFFDHMTERIIIFPV
jgi:hypothetical protein